MPTEAMFGRTFSSSGEWREEGKAKMKAAMWDSILATVKAKKPDDRQDNASPIFISLSSSLVNISCMVSHAIFAFESESI